MQQSLIVKARKSGKKTQKTDQTYTRLIYFLVENLIPFQYVKRSHFSCLLSKFVDGCGTNAATLVANDILSVKTLKHHCHQMYNDYQSYLINYIKSQENLKINLQAHRWKFVNNINPLIFLSKSFIDSDFFLFDFPLGLVEWNGFSQTSFFNSKSFPLLQSQLSGQLFKNVKANISFITTNFLMCKEMAEFFAKEGTHILQCLPSFINEVVVDFIDKLIKEFSLGETHPNARMAFGEAETIRNRIHFFLLPILRKVNEQALNSSNEIGNTLEFFIAFKTDLKKNTKKNKTHSLSSNEIAIVEFIVEFMKRFVEVVEISLSVEYPSTHMILKWVKVLIVHTTAFLEMISNGFFSNSMDKKVKNFLREILEKLTTYHASIDNEFEMLLASYLHPSTRRYLKENDITKINAYVESLSNDPNKSLTQDVNETESFENLDDMIMKVFNCSGSGNKECYNYEISSSSEIKYCKTSKYISLESGPFILEFWKANRMKYPVLSSIARETLSIQLNSNRKYDILKDQFSTLKKANHSTQEIQEVQFLNFLSRNYDLTKFNPKVLDSKIQEFRLKQNSLCMSDDDKKEDKFIEAVEFSDEESFGGIIEEGEVEDANDVEYQKEKDDISHNERVEEWNNLVLSQIAIGIAKGDQEYEKEKPIMSFNSNSQINLN